jgi:hypothetical protein
VLEQRYQAQLEQAKQSVQLLTRSVNALRNSRLEVEMDDEGDLMVQSIDVWFASTDGGSQSQEPWDYFEEITLLVDGEEVDSMDVDSESDWSSDSDGQIGVATTGEEYRLRFTNLDFVLESDQTIDISLNVTVGNVIDGDDDGETWNVAISQLRTVDGTGFVTNEAVDTTGASTYEDSFTVNANAEEASIDVTDKQFADAYIQQTTGIKLA